MTTLLEEVAQCGDWKTLLENKSELLRILDEELRKEEQKHTVLPLRGKRLQALKSTPLTSVKVVILGQDPYPGFCGEVPNAMGLAFSVGGDMKPPASLKNMYRELASEPGFVAPEHGDLSAWAEQGVLLLNTVMSVRAGEAGSHRKLGWSPLTTCILEAVACQNEKVVFLSFGRDSHRYAEIFESRGHAVIKTSHPSPLGATKSAKDGSFCAFRGSACFQQANDKLKAFGRRPVNWYLPRHKE